MIWLRLFWWMVWRGAVSGTALGALFGTIIALFLGTFFGAVYGAIFGIATGIVNGIALAILTRFWFRPPQDSPQFRRSAITLVVVCTLVTGFTMMSSLMIGTTALIIVPTLIATIAAGLTTRRFPAYAVEAFLDQEYSQEPIHHDDKYYRL